MPEDQVLVPLRVLILEDNEDDTHLLLRSLRQNGFEVDPVVANDESKYRAAIYEDLDLILADFSLPGFDAPRALEILNDSALDVPFIVVTGTVEEDEVVKCMRLGAADYLLKDRLVRLGEAVSHALTARKMRGESRRAEVELAEAREQAQKDYDMLLGRLEALAQRVGLARNSASIYRALFDFCIEQTATDGIFVARYDEDSELRTCVFSMNLANGKYEEHDVSRLPPLPLTDSPQSRAVIAGEVLITHELPEVLKVVPSYDVGGDEDDELEPLSSAAVPLRVLGRIIGVFEVQSTKPRAFREADVVALTTAANYAAIALENVGLLARERELRLAAEDTERRYRELVEQASDAIIVFDGRGALLHANSTAFRMAGIAGKPPQEINVRDWMSPEDLAEHPLRYGNLEVGATLLSERRFRRPDGSDLPVEINTKRLSEDTYQAIVRDVSERKLVEEALLNEKNFSDTVINSLPGIFYLVDEDFGLVRWNANLTAVTGYDDAAVEDLSPLEFFAAEQREYLAKYMRLVLNRGTGSVQANLLTKEGKSVPYAFSAVCLKMDGRKFVAGTGQDVSRQQEAEERERKLNLELENRLARLSALHEIDMAITGSVDLRLTLNVVLDKVVRELSIDAGSIWIFEKPNQAFRCVVTRGLPETAGRRPEVRLGKGPLGRCGLERTVMRLGNGEIAENNLLLNGSREFTDYLALPLISKGQLQGVLEVFNTAEQSLDDDRLEFLEALGLQTAIAIDNVTMFQDLERSTVDLTLAYDATIEGWARALDMRDHETEGHSRRVTELTLLLARQMGVEGDDLAHFRRGALLHDIGKLGVPDAILTKPGPLTEDERNVMQRHAHRGYELLAPITFLRPAIEIPYCHHEAWDGSGYPRGLSGEEIPLAARIFAVADVFDALTSDRPYRRAWPRAKALDYLRERSGIQFDAQVIRAFLELDLPAEENTGKDGIAPE
ncbi:MAG: HD domain-containing phosphohydrolase [Trueperaceae bacterium]